MTHLFDLGHTISSETLPQNIDYATCGNWYVANKDNSCSAFEQSAPCTKVLSDNARVYLLLQESALYIMWKVFLHNGNH